MCINTSLVSETERPNREILDKNCQKQRLLCSIRLNSTSSLEKFERELSDLITQSRR
jgi:ferredoxin